MTTGPAQVGIAPTGDELAGLGEEFDLADAAAAQLQVVTSAQARAVVPYFGRVWEIPRGRGGGQVAFTLLLQPGNQPGLIP